MKTLLKSIIFLVLTAFTAAAQPTGITKLTSTNHTVSFTPAGGFGNFVDVEATGTVTANPMIIGPNPVTVGSQTAGAASGYIDPGSTKLYFGNPSTFPNGPFVEPFNSTYFGSAAGLSNLTGSASQLGNFSQVQSDQEGVLTQQNVNTNQMTKTWVVASNSPTPIFISPGFNFFVGQLQAYVPDPANAALCWIVANGGSIVKANRSMATGAAISILGSNTVGSLPTPGIGAITCSCMIGTNLAIGGPLNMSNFYNNNYHSCGSNAIMLVDTNTILSNGVINLSQPLFNGAAVYPMANCMASNNGVLYVGFQYADLNQDAGQPPHWNTIAEYRIPDNAKGQTLSFIKFINTEQYPLLDVAAIDFNTNNGMLFILAEDEVLMGAGDRDDYHGYWVSLDGRTSVAWRNTNSFVWLPQDSKFDYNIGPFALSCSGPSFVNDSINGVVTFDMSGSNTVAYVDDTGGNIHFNNSVYVDSGSELIAGVGKWYNAPGFEFTNTAAGGGFITDPAGDVDFWNPGFGTRAVFSPNNVYLGVGNSFSAPNQKLSLTSGGLTLSGAASYFSSNSLTWSQITNGLTPGGSAIATISNVVWSFKLSNNIVVSNKLN